jgi:hypothetical protein
VAMNWTSLSAAKGTSGSIANWVSYTKLDIPVIVDEAQALLYEFLRTREMRTQTVFLISNGNSEVALPARFLDPIGRIKGIDFNLDVRHKDENFLTRARSYTGTTGSLGNNPFTTTNTATTVSVNLTAHGFNQGGTFQVIGASAFNGITLSPGAYPIISITDANNFVIDTVTQTASGSGAGGGAAVTYTANSLVAGVPQFFAVWDEKIKLDFAMNQDMTFVLNYFQSLPLLSASNLTNFITSRYPQLMRAACQVAAADFMKDDAEYQKGSTRLLAHIQRINIENDGFYRGLELNTETP